MSGEQNAELKPSEHGRGDGVLHSLGWFWRNYWVFRGVFAAWLVVSVIPIVVPSFTQWEVLRAFHALVVEWRAALHWLALQLPQIAWFQPTAADLFAISFMLSIGLPTALVPAKPIYEVWWILERDSRRKTEGNVTNDAQLIWLLRLTLPLMVTMGLLFLWFAYDVAVEIYSKGSVFGFGVQDFAKIGEWSFWVRVLSDAIPMVLIAYWALAFVFFRGYFRGAVYLIGFIAAIEVLYLLNTPYLTDWINARVADAIGPDPLAK